MQHPFLPPDVDAWLTHNRVAAVRQAQPGMSGGVVYQCDADDGQSLALKRWPDGTDPGRVSDVHNIEMVAHANGCEFIPALSHSFADNDRTFIVADRAIWELAQWMPGAPLPTDASPELVAAGASAIAQFHRSVLQLHSSIETPPAVLNRMRRVAELDELLPQVYAARADAGHSIQMREVMDDACELLHAAWPNVREQTNRSLTPRSRQTLPIQYVLRDVHREHVLFNRGAVSGIIDFDAVRIDTPLTDLARWGGSFTTDRKDREPIWEAVTAGYLANCPFQQRMDLGQFIGMIRELYFSSIWISLANWAVWIQLESRKFPPGELAVITRIKQLIGLARQEM